MFLPILNVTHLRFKQAHPKMCHSPKVEKTHESESAGFLVQALPMVQNQFWKRFSNKVLYNYYSKKNLGFRSVFKKIKKWIFACIFKMWFAGGLLFHPKKNLKKPNTWECAQVLVVTRMKIDCVEALLCIRVTNNLYWP